MGKGFEACVANGGKVRTKSLSGNRSMRFCIQDGKTFAGEIKQSTKEEEKTVVKEEEQIEIIEELHNQDIMIIESQGFEIIEEHDDGKVSLNFTAAEAGVSGNNRRYFSKELQTQKLGGLKMFMNHTYEAENAVGIITESAMTNIKTLGAKATIMNTAKHPDVVNMIKNKLIDSVSIGGKGDIKRVKEKGKIIDEVHNLKIKEVSFVGIGGISKAKIKTVGG